MAENDYIGNIQTNRWNSLNQGYLSRTPSWMQGEFKQGPRVGTQRFQATTSGARLNWGQGDTSPRVHAFGAKQSSMADQIAVGVKKGLALKPSTTSTTSTDSGDSEYSMDSDDTGSKYFDDIFPKDSGDSGDSAKTRIRSMITKRATSRAMGRSRSSDEGTY